MSPRRTLPFPRVRLLARCALASVALLVAARTARAQQPPDTTLVHETIAEGVYLFRAPSDLDLWTATNVVVVVNDDDVTVFDSNSRARTARMVIDEIRRLTPRPVRILVNSHWHLDHWSGNDEYARAFPGLRIISTTRTRDYMKRMTGTFYAFGLRNSVTRSRASLDSAVRSGRQADGTPLTPAARAKREQDIRDTESFAAEVESVPRVLPNVTYVDSMTFWSGTREFRLISVTGDATASTVLYLPRERILAMGDALVRPERGEGPPPWTTNSYAITPWRDDLRTLSRLDARIIVPGQGAAMFDKSYLDLTVELYSAVLDQVHAALERGRNTLATVSAAVNVDDIGRRYSPGASAPPPEFNQLVSALVRKALQEALDGVTR